MDYLTYETLWGLEVLPEHMLVIGAGPIGCEMSQAFRRLGARVTLIASQDRVLPRDDVQILTDGDNDLERYINEYFPEAEHTIDV